MHAIVAVPEHKVTSNNTQCMSLYIKTRTYNVCFIIVMFAGATQALVTCFGSAGCTGRSTSNISPRVCCVGAGVSYNDGVSCFECIGEWRVVCLD